MSACCVIENMKIKNKAVMEYAISFFVFFLVNFNFFIVFYRSYFLLSFKSNFAKRLLDDSLGCSQSE